MGDNKHPFIFTNLNDEAYLEFAIKIYTNPKGVTHHLNKLVTGEELIISDQWRAIIYSGPGYFIAGWGRHYAIYCNIAVVI